MELQCHKGCIHKRNIPGNTHISCAEPDLTIKGNAHGIRKGWFIYPIIFDPIWGESECKNYKTKTNE